MKRVPEVKSCGYFYQVSACVWMSNHSPGRCGLGCGFDSSALRHWALSLNCNLFEA